LDILKSKQRNVDTIEIAIKSCEEELLGIEKELEESKGRVGSLKNNLSEIIGNYDLPVNLEEINAVDDEILKLRTEISALEQQHLLENKREEFGSDLSELKISRGKLKKETDILLHKASDEMETLISCFNSKYLALMKDTVPNCREAQINEDYMPIINNGEHLQASAMVPTRLMYYLTLLYLSLINSDVRFPRFLLIDTPDTAGIEDDNLLESLKAIDKILPSEGYSEGFQIILTTAIDKYPPKYKDKVMGTLTKEKRLLIQRDKEES
jgi:hypothetical protein